MLKKRFFAVVSALSLVVTAAPITAPYGLKEVQAAETAVLDNAPPVPSITRYSTSAWDATWFRMDTNLQVGTCIYTIDADPTKNEKDLNPDDYTITELPKQFVGCDYIMNRINANTQPNRDHHFYAEQDIVIYAAIDTAQQDLPSSLSGYEKTEGTLKIKNGTEFYLAKREYSAGQVILNRYNGTGSNVFYMILPKDGEAVSKVLADNKTTQVPEGDKPAKNAADTKYQYYLNSVYNNETADVPAGYTGEQVSLSGLKTIVPPEPVTYSKTYAEGENMALNKPVSGDNKGTESPVDGDWQTYYEAATVPSNLIINLQAETKINKIVMGVRQKESWKTRTQNIEVLTSLDGETYTTLFEKKDYEFPYDKPVELTFAEPVATSAKFIKVVGYSNTGAAGMQMAEVEVYGPAQTVIITEDPEPLPPQDLNRWVIVGENGNLTKTFDTALSGKLVYEGKVKASVNNKEMSIPVMKSSDGKTALDLTFAADGKIKAGNTEVTEYEADKWYVIKLLVDTETKTYDVYVDHMRKAQGVAFADNTAGDIKSIAWTSGEGRLNVDNVRVYDNPEVYVMQDNFNAEETGASQPANWTVSDAAKTSIENVPFASDKSLQLTGAGVKATRSFGELTGDVTIEAKIKPMKNTWVSVPVVYDSEGEAVLKVAAYRNSFFISNGDNWEYICSQETKHNYYPAANWYTVKIVLNTFSNRYDFYVDGAKRFTQASFMADVDNVSYMEFAAEEDNVLYIDNVNVYDSASLARGMYPKENVFNVKDFGAVGDGKTDDTKAIEDAMKAAAYTGGTVLLENGTFYCGQITMENDMTLFIDASATIFFKMNRNDYVHFRPKYNGIVGYNGNHQLGAGLIRSIEGNNNFRINGGGTVDGNGFYGFNENDPGNQRPCALYLTSSDDFSVENINIINSPHWTFVPYESTRMTIRNVSITNHIAPNRDGIDPTNCSNMTIENCYIFAGDDAICPKSGNAFPSINCDVRNCTLQSYCNGIKFGTDSYDDFKNYTFEDILIKNVGLSGITLQAVDGSEIENITFKRIDMMDVDNSIAFMVGDRKRANIGLGAHLGHIKGVTIEDMNYTNPMVVPYSHQDENEHANMFVALDPNRHNDGKDAHIISDVTLKNVYLEMPGGYTTVPAISGGINGGYPEHGGMGNPTGWANTIRWAKNITFDNCQSVLLTEDVRTEYDYADYYEGENLDEGVEGKVQYGIVFEDAESGEVLKNPVLSGVIAYENTSTVLNYTLLHTLQEKNDFILDKALYEGAVVTCDDSGDLTLMDASKTKVLAEAEMEKFSNEEGERLVFHVKGRPDADAKMKQALTKAVDYLDKEELYTTDSWARFEAAYEEAKDDDGTGDIKKLLKNLTNAMNSLVRPLGEWIELESGELIGAGTVEASESASGGAYVGNVGGDSKVVFRIKARRAGTYRFSVYACQAGNRVLNIKVDGKDNNLPCSSSGSWNKPTETADTINIKLTRGVHEIALMAANDWAPNLDRLKVEKIEAEADEEAFELSDLVDAAEAKEYVEAEYTKESYAAYKKALEDAKALLDNEEADAKDLTDAHNALVKAEKELKKAEKPKPEGKPVDTTVIDLTPDEKEIADKLGVSAETAKEIRKVADEYKISDDTLYITEKSVKATKSEGDLKGSSFAAIQAKASKQTKNTIKLSWNKVKGADGYLVFGNKCGKKNAYELKKNITKVTKAKTTSYTQKNLKKNTYYKFVVVAYKNVGDAKVTLAASKTIHETVKGGKYGYIKSMSVKKSAIKLNKKKTFNLGAKMKKAGKKVTSHRGIKYESTNSKIAAVNSKGKITAKKKGTCYVYAYAQNGVFKKVKVTVK